VCGLKKARNHRFGDTGQEKTMMEAGKQGIKKYAAAAKRSILSLEWGYGVKAIYDYGSAMGNKMKCNVPGRDGKATKTEFQ
jgi:hypothetical protein